MLLFTFVFAPVMSLSLSLWSCLFVPFLDMVVEKNLRGVLRSEVDRSVSRDSIIIVDSLNNIKVGSIKFFILFSQFFSVSNQFWINNIILHALSLSVCLSVHLVVYTIIPYHCDELMIRAAEYLFVSFPDLSRELGTNWFMEVTRWLHVQSRP